MAFWFRALFVVICCVDVQFTSHTASFLKVPLFPLTAQVSTDYRLPS